MAGRPKLDSERFWKKVDIENPDDCWEWKAGKFSNGYGQFYTGGSRKESKKICAHRMSYELTFGKIEKTKLNVCHKCDNRGCVNPNHLFLGTSKDNHRDMIEKGRKVNADKKGELNGRAKITKEQVDLIRKMYENKEGSARSIGERFGISETQTFRIIHRESWSD